MTSWRGPARVRQTYFSDAVLKARATLFLTVRLAVRINQAMPPGGAAAPGAGPWRAALPAFVIGDVVIWRVLCRSDRLGLQWRLPLDMLDIGFWSLSPLPPSGHYEAALLGAMPLAIEAGFRIGLRGLVIPALALPVVAATRALQGRPPNLIYLDWLVLGVGTGMALWGYCDRLLARVEREHRQVQAAEQRRAFLAGQNEVAMGASSAVDVMEGLVPILGPPAPGSALWQLADGWKSQLGQSTAPEATYLHVAMLEWERQHNQHPDLSSRVEVQVAEGDGTTLLTRAQVSHLARIMEGLGLRGRCEVRLAGDVLTRLPGARLRLLIGGLPVDIPADRRSGPRAIDPGPIAYLLIAVYVAIMSSPSWGAVSRPALTVGVAICLVVGWWSHRRLTRFGPAARPAVLAGAALTALALTCLLTPAIRQPLNMDGTPAYPFAAGGLLLAFLGGMYHESVRKHGLVLANAILGVYALGVALAPASTVQSLFASLVWCVMPYPPCRRVTAELTKAAHDHARAALEADLDAAGAAFWQGQESVAALVRQAHDDAACQLGDLGGELDPPLAQLAAHRLEEVERRLSTMGPAPASSLSTTIA